MAEVADCIRVGTRNAQNFELLKEVGLTNKPVMLKRGLAMTIDEWLQAAEYVAQRGNSEIILCERGIRTFEPSTRNTLDLAGMAVAQRESHLPVIVDPSHAVGKRDLVAPMALAAVAAGADAVMIDVHAEPEQALVDGPQALLPEEMVALGRADRAGRRSGRSPAQSVSHQSGLGGGLSASSISPIRSTRSCPPLGRERLLELGLEPGGGLAAAGEPGAAVLSDVNGRPVAVVIDFDEVLQPEVLDGVAGGLARDPQTAARVRRCRSRSGRWRARSRRGIARRSCRDPRGRGRSPPRSGAAFVGGRP